LYSRLKGTTNEHKTVEFEKKSFTNYEDNITCLCYYHRNTINKYIIGLYLMLNIEFI